MSAEKRKHPTVGPSFLIEQEALKLLEALLPASWLCRPQRPDFFIDYKVEVVEAGEPTGLQFDLQVKGKQRAKIRKGTIRFPMERKHLLYYRDNARAPVFLALVDVEERKAYWLFAQRYLRERARGAQLESQNTLTVSFNVEDCFSDRDRLLAAIKDAERYMRDLYPGSVVAAVEQRRRSLQQLDPNVAVNVSVQEGHEVIQIHPSVPVSISFASRDAGARERYQRMIEHGEVFLAEMELVNPSDSALVRELMPLGTYRIEFKPKSRPGSAQLRWKGSKFLQVEGTWRGGNESMHFAGGLLGSPLSVDISITRGVNDGELEMSVSTPLRLDEWEGQPVLSLPWFDQLRGLVCTLASGEEVGLAYFVEGLRIGSGQLTATDSAINRHLHEEFDWLERVQSLAERYNINARLPKLSALSYQMEKEVDALWALTRGDSFQHEIPGATFECVSESETPLPVEWQSGKPQSHGTMKIVGSSPFNFLGHLVEVPDVENTMTDVELISFEDTESPTRKRLAFRAGEKAVWFQRRMEHATGAR